MRGFFTARIALRAQNPGLYGPQQVIDCSVLLLHLCCCPSQDLAQLSTSVDLNTPSCIYCCSSEHTRPVPELPTPAARPTSAGKTTRKSAAAAAAAGGRNQTNSQPSSRAVRVGTTSGSADDGAAERTASDNLWTQREGVDYHVMEPLLACSTCPASFHPSCYMEGAREEVRADRSSISSSSSCAVAFAVTSVKSSMQLHHSLLHTLYFSATVPYDHQLGLSGTCPSMQYVLSCAAEAATVYARGGAAGW
jgi:hypothetical protein